MGENTKIEWCDHTFNPWIGCQRVSPACDHCYAEAMDRRTGGSHWGPHAERRRTSESYWRQPLKWNAEYRKAGIRRRVFCASMADVFDNAVAEKWRDDLWELIAVTPHLDWLLLSKRPQNIAKMLPKSCAVQLADNDWPWPHVWLGTTAENQEEADRRIPHMLSAPARVHFLSCEPLLGRIDLLDIPWLPGRPRFPQTDDISDGRSAIHWVEGSRIDWVICGGESGPHARPMHPDWARSLRDQCQSAGVSFFFKQWGAWAPLIDRGKEDPDWRRDYGVIYRDPKHYRIINLAGGCGFHGERVHLMKRAPKRAAGRALDEREWNEVPEVAYA